MGEAQGGRENEELIEEERGSPRTLIEANDMVGRAIFFDTPPIVSDR